MPDTSILNLPGIIIEKEERARRYKGLRCKVYRVRFKSHTIRCPHCHEQTRLRKKSKLTRLVWHFFVGRKAIGLHIHGHKYHCQQCLRYFNQRYPGIEARRRYSELFRTETVNQHHVGIAQSTLSLIRGISSATVERWYHQLLYKKSKEYLSYQYGPYIGIDEHFFSKRGIKYVTTLCDLSKHRVIDIIPAKSGPELIKQMSSIPGAHNVKMVCIDLADHYRSLSKQLFPNAVIVADRFHVIRLINHHFLKTWALLDPIGRKNRPLLSLMRRHASSLRPDQHQRLQNYLSSLPALQAIYDFKQSLTNLLLIKHRTVKQCRRLIPQFLSAISQLKLSFFHPLVTLGNTLDSWKDEIAAMWRFTKNNGITEGFHRKMKLIQRRAYGFKNFQNYRLRVKLSCTNNPLLFS